MQSNGSLMRISPMAVFFGLTNYDFKEHMEFIRSNMYHIQTKSALAIQISIFNQQEVATFSYL